MERLVIVVVMGDGIMMKGTFIFAPLISNLSLGYYVIITLRTLKAAI